MTECFSMTRTEGDKTKHGNLAGRKVEKERGEDDIAKRVRVVNQTFKVEMIRKDHV